MVAECLYHSNCHKVGMRIKTGYQLGDQILPLAGLAIGFEYSPYGLYQVRLFAI